MNDMAGGKYLVKPGDNLWNIARAQGVDFDELKRLNPALKLREPPYGINPGDQLELPVPPAAAAATAAATATNANAGGCTTKCPPVFVLVIELIAPNGRTDGGTDRYGFVYSDDLAPHRSATVTGWVGVFLDVTGQDYAKSVVPKSFSDLVSGYKSLYYDLTEAQFKDLKNLYLWSGDMLLSFFVDKGPGQSFAKMRLDVPRRLGVEEAITTHPRTGTSVPNGSKKLRFTVMVLESPVVYMLDEINTNARSDDIPTTSVGWAWRAQEGRPWDYKHPIRRIWSDKVRLGNYAVAVGTGAFSNYHYGYVAAAGGFKRERTLDVSDWAQVFSTFSWDPVEDVFATGAGHDQFVKNNGPIVTLKKTVPGAIPFTWQEVEFPVHQTIRADLALTDLRAFLLQYQGNWNANR